MEDVEFIPPEPIEHEDGSLEWPQAEDYIPTEIPEQDLNPVEVDEDYSPGEEEDEEDV